MLHIEERESLSDPDPQVEGRAAGSDIGRAWSAKRHKRGFGWGWQMVAYASLVEHGGDLLRDHHPSGDPRGTFTSVKDLIAAIEIFIDGWNERCEPFVWTKTADDILTKAHRKTTSNTRH